MLVATRTAKLPSSESPNRIGRLAATSWIVDEIWAEPSPRSSIRQRTWSRSPFADVVRTGLLDVEVLAGLAGQDGGRPMPVVGGCDPDGVDGPVVEHSPKVLDGPGRLAGDFCLVGRQSGPRLINVAGIGEIDIVPPGQGPDVTRP
jgi:hypothetical protein